MATITSNGTGGGNFNTGATWVGGVAPGNNDAFVVASTDTVVFDLDSSGFANGFAASTINGILQFKRTAGAYYLKMNGILTVSTTGTIDASDGAGGALPAVATATIAFTGNFSLTLTGNAVYNLICGEPTHKYVKLTQNESIGATTLHVDADVSGGGADALWANPSLVRIDDINQAVESEERTISSVTSTTVVITAGLTAAKSTGAYIILVSRNVKVLGAATGSGVSGGTNGVIKAEVRALANGIILGSSHTLGGTISNCTNGINSSNGATVNAVITGCTTGCNGGAGVTLNELVSGCTTGIVSGGGYILNATCILSGMTTGLSFCFGCLLLGAKVTGCANGMSAGSDMRLLGAQLSSNSQDVINVINLQAVNTLFGSSTEFSGYNAVQRAIVAYAESIDHDQTAGAFRAWTRGGVTSSVSSPVFDASRVRSYNAVCESASFPVYFQRQIVVPAKGTLHVRLYIRKDASMAYLPRLWIFSAEKEPLLSGSPDVEVQMTNSVDTWETLMGSITNSTDASKSYIVRMAGKNASGNVYFDPQITVNGISRARLVNGA